MEVCKRSVRVSVLTIGVCQAQLLLELLQVRLISRSRVEEVRAVPLDNVSPSGPTRPCPFERAPQHEHCLFQPTRVGRQLVMVRPEPIEQLLSGDVPSPLEIQQRE